jgi:O-antigen/teichoic acid export membrane protein
LSSKWVEIIWHQDNKILIIFASIAAFLQNSVWPSMQQALEAQRKTYIGQIISISTVIVHLIAITLLCFFQYLGLITIFIAVLIEYSIAIFISYRYLDFNLDRETDEKYKIELRQIAKMYINFCSPIIIYSVISFLYSFIDTWLLQKFGGSQKQAIYAVSNQFSSIALLATSAISNIFFKEITEAFHNNDLIKVGIVYSRVYRFLFVIAALISCFLIPWTKNILQYLLGDSYTAGYLTLSIMLLYPIHQSIGQIGGSVLFAVEHVALQVKIGIIFMILSMFVTYFVLAPTNAIIPGLNLGSEGLALKMLLMQFLQVNIIIYFISNILNLKFDYALQFIVIITLLIISYITFFSINYFQLFSNSFLISIIFGFILYLFLVFIILFYKPRLLGINKLEIVNFFNKLSFKF